MDLEALGVEAKVRIVQAVQTVQNVQAVFRSGNLTF
jgi:hypothetical protein